MLTTITRRLEIDAGHRLLAHESKCRNAHGHRYAFEVTVSGAALDDCGRLIDFGAVKQLVAGWLDAEWDHGFLAQAGDPLIEPMRALGLKLVVLDVPPSIEHLTAIVLARSAPLLAPDGLRVVRVRGYETPNCWADVEP